MTLPEAITKLPLTRSESKTIEAIYRSSVDGISDISTEQLGQETGYTMETLRRAFRKLESLGVLRTERTKKNYSPKLTGRFANNRYYVNVGSSDVGSSYDQGDSNSYTVVNRKSTTYSFNVKGEEVRSYDDGDNIGGFGLFEEEIAKPVVKINKRDPKTRGKRPEHEWTVYDVSSEFSYQLGRKFPYTPGLVNVAAISGALRKYRTEYGTTAVVEMEILRKFFSDERNYRNADQSPEKVHSWYLRMMKTHMSEVLNNFDMPEDDEVSTDVDEFLYAVDGKRFDNSFAGRKALEAYEIKVKETDDV